jgi:hypothetical protein
MPETELEVKNRLCRKCRNNKVRRNQLNSPEWTIDMLECWYPLHPIQSDGKDCGYFQEGITQ